MRRLMVLINGKNCTIEITSNQFFRLGEYITFTLPYSNTPELELRGKVVSVCGTNEIFILEV